MPEIARLPFRFDCQIGLDLVSPFDRMPPGAYPVLTNVRVIKEGRLDCRAGDGSFATVAVPPAYVHSVRRLNFPGGYIYVVGNSGSLLAGVESALAVIATGFSGNPLSLLTFRPSDSPQSWMYVYDSNQQIKVSSAGVVRAIGAVPPGPPISATYGPPAIDQLATGNATFGWATVGTAASVTLVDRTGGATTTIATIIYDSGTTGWCCIQPTSTAALNWAGNWMQIVLNSSETVVVREIHPPIMNTTIQGIVYDSGTFGLCTVVLANSPAGLVRNSVLFLNFEFVRVLSVTPTADGTGYSLRCSTTINHVAGETVQSGYSFYCYTTATHAAGETISASGVGVTIAAAATASGLVLKYGTITGTYTASGANVTYASGSHFVPWPAGTLVYISGVTYPIVSVADSTHMVLGSAPPASGTWTVTNVDLSHAANGRVIDLANDYLHCSLYFSAPQALTSVSMQIDVGDGSFTQNYLTLPLTLVQLNDDGLGGASGSVWFEALAPLSQAIRSGPDTALNLTTVTAIQIVITSTAACNLTFASWYLFGTYGAVIVPGAVTGYLYASVNRDSTTGDKSIAGPPPMYELFPVREQVLITPATSGAAGIDSLDIYRQGGALSEFTYIGTVINNPVTPNVFADVQPDSYVAGNPAVDETQIQPWPITVNPLMGTCNTNGTEVTIIGTPLPTTLLRDTEITINGTAYQLYDVPYSGGQTLQLVTSAGVQSAVPYLIATPTLSGQPLPYAFGPLEGPFAPVAFALGDPINAGLLYYSNTADLDGASDQNTLEICPPSEPLVSGDVWNGICVVGSRDNLYVVRYSYLTTLGISTGPGGTVYQFARIPSASGIWSRWACKRGPDGIYFLGRDGIYRATDQGAENITDPRLYPLFPHDGQPAMAVNGYQPVDMTQTKDLRISASDEDVYFDYIDTAGNGQTLRYEIAQKRWFHHNYADPPTTHYLVELAANSPNQQQLLLCSRTLGLIYLAGGNTDNGSAIVTQVRTPSLDGGDERGQKLYVDMILDQDSANAGSMGLTVLYNNGLISSAQPAIPLALGAGRQQYITNLNSQAQNLALYRNIAIQLSWSGGPQGPVVYAFESSGYAQPYLSQLITTQFLNLDEPAWKSHRRLYPGMISVAPCLFTIKCQDGRTFTYTIPSTNGQWRIFPLMLDQTIKDLGFAYELKSQAITSGLAPDFALFPEAFTLESKGWADPNFIELAIFKT